MLVRAGYDIGFELAAPTPIQLMLYVHPSRDATTHRPDHIKVEPAVSIREYRDPFGNRCGMLIAPAGSLRIWNDIIVQDSGQPDPVDLTAEQHAVESLPAEVIPYLFASRYCEVDELVATAWELFKDTPPGWARVQAISDWCHANVTFGYEHARATKTARQVLDERKGVCRDFMHLAVTFCRCMNIPARYVTGYLGDIGVPPNPHPMDFSAWFEVFLGGKWHTFDARHNARRIARILMATGRDAVDVALTTSFGSAKLTKFVVWTDEVSADALTQPASIKE
jgi:transglutaminase-like putative cysteine protease